jgi:hypothetical protein
MVSDKNVSGQKFLRLTALTILLVGAMTSLYFMFNATSSQKSILLLGLFTAWVLSPFMGFIAAERLSKLWTGKVHSWLYPTMIMVTAVSVTFYTGVLTGSYARPAVSFLVIPFISWLMIIAILLKLKRRSGSGRSRS